MGTVDDERTTRVTPEPRVPPRSAADLLRDGRAFLAIAAGQPHGPDRTSFAFGGVLCAGVLLLVAVDDAASSVGATPLHLAVLLLGGAALLLCTFVLVTGYRRLDDQDGLVVDRDPGAAARQHGFLLLWSVAALAYGIETMSALSALVRGGGDMWTARGFFAWHVADTLPVFTVTDTLHLGRPAMGMETAGAMALLVKVALILPLVRIAVATFRLAEGTDGALVDARRWFLFAPRRFRPDPRVAPERQPRLEPLWSAARAVVVVMICGGGLALLLTVCNWVGPLTEGIASQVSTANARRVRAVGDGIVGFLGSWTVQATILAILSVTLVLSTALVLRSLLRVDLGQLDRVPVGMAVLVASLVSLVLVVSAAAAVDLTISCLVDRRTPMIEAAGHLEWYVWHALDVAPELTAPRVLDWRAPADPSGVWSGPLLLVVKLIAVLVIAVPVARVVRAARRTWPNHLRREPSA